MLTGGDDDADNTEHVSAPHSGNWAQTISRSNCLTHTHICTSFLGSCICHHARLFQHLLPENMKIGSVLFSLHCFFPSSLTFDWQNFALLFKLLSVYIRECHISVPFVPSSLQAEKIPVWFGFGSHILRFEFSLVLRGFRGLAVLIFHQWLLKHSTP